jgi:ankyrin repeat protein
MKKAHFLDLLGASDPYQKFILKNHYNQLMIYEIDVLTNELVELMKTFDILGVRDIVESVDININKFITVNNDNLLHIAVRMNDIKFIKYFVKNGIDIDRENDDFQTPLDIASENHNDDIIKYLTDQLAKNNRFQVEKSEKEYPIFLMDEDLDLYGLDWLSLNSSSQLFLDENK